MAYSALDVAQYIINKFTEKKMMITNIRLQRILYFVQAQSFSAINEPMFDDAIEAWSIGPVISKVYHAYKNNNFESVGLKKARIGNTHKFLIDFVLEQCSKYTTSELISIIRNQPPWAESYEMGKHRIISNGKFTKYFSNKKEIFY